MTRQWIIPPVSQESTALADRRGLPSLIAHILSNRGIHEEARIDGFLTPQLKDLHSPAMLPGANAAAELLVAAVRSKRTIVLYGDYDVDGTAGVAILWHALRQAGAEPRFYVPHRIEEGYGLNATAVRRLVEDGAELIVAIDCGITAVDIAAELQTRGIPLLILDHHVLPAELPAATAIVHPSIGGAYPNPNLCATGVAFKVAWAFAQRMCGADRVDPAYRNLLLKELLPLAALGTIADVVPLTGENRIIARHGLHGLAASAVPGICALIESSGLNGAAISDYDVGFKLAPRINAAGRMGHARLAVELLTWADAARAREIALYLEGHNRSRQSAERKIAQQAREMVERDDLAGDAHRAIVLASPRWHAGVIGIVAARLVERYHRPAILIALSADGGQGSGRSISGFDLAGALTECEEHLIAHGGHAMAAGLRIAPDRVEAFRRAFVEVANQRLTAGDLQSKLRLDAEVRLKELTLPTAELILSLGPFGLGNPKPKLGTDFVELAAEPRCVGAAQDHLQAVFQQDGVMVRGIGFGLASAIEDLKQHRRCRLAFEPIINDFNGRKDVEMRILDFKYPSPT